ncbi:MAG: AAA family ATPase [Myxococcales bacterium]|nr:AAA family ATPase [Myxococcales bacterium]
MAPEAGALDGSSVGALAAGVRAHQKLAISQALNLVEDRRPAARDAVSALLGALHEPNVPAQGQRVGLTGPPGVGKSSLAAALARELRHRGRTVGVVAIDPTSVRSGGSILGDRARMGFDPSDEGIFVRSFATGGEAGGLSWATHAAVEVLGAAYEVVLVETTGVGQTETDVRHVADTVALVIQPGSGDVLQFIKAGVMEIPDVLVVNKADHEALAARALADLRGAAHSVASAGAGGALPMVATSATIGLGVAALADALDAHHRSLDALEARRLEGDVAWSMQLFVRRHGEHGVLTLGGRAALEAELRQRRGEGSPPALAERLSERFLAALRGQPGAST